MTTDQPQRAPGWHDLRGLENAPRVYADAFNVTASLFTVTLICAVKAANVVGNEADVRVVLDISPQMAAKLADLLHDIVQRYEKDTGVTLTPKPLSTQK